jgi:STE24 endopeptidase
LKEAFKRKDFGDLFMNLFLVIILVILIGDYVLGLVVDVLNVKYLKTDLPAAFSGYYDEEKYRKSQEYLKENTRFGLITDSITTPAVIAFILLGGFNWVDQWARAFHLGVPLGRVLFLPPFCCSDPRY